MRCLPTLRKLMNARVLSKRRQLLRSCRGGCIYYAISEISRNILNGRIPLSGGQWKVLNRYKDQLRELRKKSISLKRRKVIANQRGGLLPGLLKPAIAYLEKFEQK